MLTIHVAKTKVLVRFAVTVKLSCACFCIYVGFLMKWLILLIIRLDYNTLSLQYICGVADLSFSVFVFHKIVKMDVGTNVILNLS